MLILAQMGVEAEILPAGIQRGSGLRRPMTYSLCIRCSIMESDFFPDRYPLCPGTRPHMGRAPVSCGEFGSLKIG